MQRFRVILALAAACFAITPPASAQAPLRDPCTLLTAAEVSAALGITSLPGRPFLGSRVSCYFAADTGIRMGAASVTVMVMTPAAFQNQGHMGGALSGHPIPGLGDEALYVSSGSYAKVLVRKGSRALSVTVVPGETSKAGTAELLEKEKALARKAAARL
jgi:hypothetical protein